METAQVHWHPVSNVNLIAENCFNKFVGRNACMGQESRHTLKHHSERVFQWKLKIENWIRYDAFVPNDHLKAVAMWKRNKMTVMKTRKTIVWWINNYNNNSNKMGNIWTAEPSNCNLTSIYWTQVSWNSMRIWKNYGIRSL